MILSSSAWMHSGKPMESNIQNLLEVYSLEELLAESDLTPEQALLLLWEQGQWEPPEAKPL